MGSEDGHGSAPGGAQQQDATSTEPRPHIADGRYLIDARLGGGGTADVYRGLDTRLNRAVAVKIFRPGAGSTAENRFREEAQLLGPLEHPSLVTVYDAGVENGRAYVVLQLVDGVTLASRLIHGALSLRQTVEVAARLADVLAYVHGRGIVHRDVKPSNVLVDESNVYLADFGISRLLGTKHNTATGLAVGTAAYMAPEQVRGLRVGPAADVYSLGLVLLECLTGRVEYPGGTVEAAIARLSRRPRVSAGLPAPVRHVLVAMTENDPERRPTAAQCAIALGKARLLLETESLHQQGKPPSAAKPSAAPKPAPSPVVEPAVETEAPNFARRFAARAARAGRGAAAAASGAAAASVGGPPASTNGSWRDGKHVGGGRHSAPADAQTAGYSERSAPTTDQPPIDRQRTVDAGHATGTDCRSVADSETDPQKGHSTGAHASLDLPSAGHADKPSTSHSGASHAGSDHVPTGSHAGPDKHEHVETVGDVSDLLASLAATRAPTSGPGATGSSARAARLAAATSALNDAANDAKPNGATRNGTAPTGAAEPESAAAPAPSTAAAADPTDLPIHDAVVDSTGVCQRVTPAKASPPAVPTASSTEDPQTSTSADEPSVTAPSGRGRRFARGRRRATPACLSGRVATAARSRTKLRLGVRGRIGVGVVGAVLVVIAGSLTISSPEPASRSIPSSSQGPIAPDGDLSVPPARPSSVILPPDPNPASAVPPASAVAEDDRTGRSSASGPSAAPSGSAAPKPSATPNASASPDGDDDGYIKGVPKPKPWDLVGWFYVLFVLPEE